MKRGYALLLVSLLTSGSVAFGDVTVKVKNELDQPRASESISVKWSDVSPMLGKAKADHVVAIDSNGKEFPIQPIFLHGQAKPADELLFQADLAPGEEKTFTLKAGTPAPYEPKVYGRWVPERLDDFGWENDRIAYRIYGPALEKSEPACSGVDVWPKKTRNLIINKWYQLAQSINGGYYHIDHGEGLDCYKVGHGQGCGGTAVWADGKRYTTGTKGWKKQRVLANGPLRVIFELTYDPIDVNGIQVSETKRVSLDAGQNLNHYECTFSTDKPYPDLTVCPGLMEHTDREHVGAMHKDQGWMTNWDAGDASPAAKDNGNVGVGLAIAPAKITDMIEADEQLLVLTKAKSGEPVSFWAGAGWDRSGDFADKKAWDDYLAAWSRRLASPVKITIEQ